MAFYIIAAFIAGILALPLDVAAEVKWRDAPGARLRVRLAGFTVYYDAVVSRREGDYVLNIRREHAKHGHSRKLSQLRSSGVPVRPALSGLRAGLALIKRNVRMDKLALRLRIGTGDAALSALVCGAALIAVTALCASADVPPEVDVEPDFQNRAFSMHARGMFSLRAGHIIGAGIVAAGEFCKGAFVEWKTQRMAIR